MGGTALCETGGSFCILHVIYRERGRKEAALWGCSL